MGEFIKQFFGFLIFSPLTAAVFGLGIWVLPAVFLRDLLTRMRLRFFHFFVSGYIFIAITAIYLLVVGAKVSAADGGGRHHQAGPIVGMLASLALSWWVQHVLRKRFPRGPRPGGPPAPTYPGVGRTGYGHPGYSHPGYGQPPPLPPGYPPHPGYPGHLPPAPQPGQSPLQPPPPHQPSGEVTAADPPRASGVPWAVPPSGPAALPPTPPVD
ncbi:MULTISPECIES: hypothetical protein [unclassified Pseudofrankia]|uniref:hypothetical protein n=1 Tax=unclassified Pseudofrankia TaxID=2994372 RepID=UPI0008DA8C26|nr:MULTISPECIES: hypothetical protein [unclassified Pseudofrankia]MDT3444106.1 hypothetical protein [Pseudofrankia sp. BMG5.37]OHV44456.1 hypothetical protein BCD48_02755 [Pseudofrankia sp. BMG5.36]